MRVAVTGTPGTGKTTAVDRLETSLEVVHLNEYIRKAGLDDGTDPERGSLLADLGAVRERLGDREDVLIESHLAHHLRADRVVVLRCHPERVRARLLERGESEATAEENAEAEALDVVLSAAVETHGLESVYEIDTTDRTPDAVAEAIATVLSGERDPTAGEVSFLEYV